ncbi:MAG: type II toxin-antitoxin system RelE/ParE family toxin [Bdellovibrionales bacterium]
MMEIRFTRRALSDLEKIKKESIEKWGKKIGSKYMSDIEDTLKTIAEFPDLLKERPFSKQTTCFCVRKHMLVFAMLDNMLYLLTVKYGGMKLEEIIPREEPTLIHEANIMHCKLSRKYNTSSE